MTIGNNKKATQIAIFFLGGPDLESNRGVEAFAELCLSASWRIQDTINTRK